MLIRTNRAAKRIHELLTENARLREEVTNQRQEINRVTAERDAARAELAEASAPAFVVRAADGTELHRGDDASARSVVRGFGVLTGSRRPRVYEVDADGSEAETTWSRTNSR